jgi:hypothetical protein
VCFTGLIIINVDEIIPYSPIDGLNIGDIEK